MGPKRKQPWFMVLEKTGVSFRMTLKHTYAQ